MTFLNNLRVAAILSSLKLVAKGMDGKNIPDSPRLEFLEKISAKTFALSEAENKISVLNK